MSGFVRAAHSRILNHSRLRSNGYEGIDPALAYPRARLLTDLSEHPNPHSTSQSFVLDETEVGLSGVRLFVWSEEQPYLRGAINALECLIEHHGLERLKTYGIVCQERSTIVAVPGKARSGH